MAMMTDYGIITPDVFNFSYALALLKDGKKVCRSGWNGKGMYIEYVEYATLNAKDSTDLTSTLPFIMMKTAQGDFVPWLASQTDLLSDDWEVAS